MSFIKQYGGWVLVGILVAVILYLVFRPLPTIDNTAALKKIDSLTNINTTLRNGLTAQNETFQKYKEVSNRVIDSLKGKNSVLSVKVEASGANEISLAKQIRYYKEHKDSVSYDSACDELATKVLSDSLIIRNYQSNTDRLIFTLGDAVNTRDSIINTQANVIYSDSVLIRTQRELTDTQQKELKKINSRAKMSTWFARSFAVIIVGLSFALATK